MSSESKIDTSYGNQMMKGVVFVAVPMALAQASAPYVGALQGQWRAPERCPISAYPFA